MNLWPNLIMTKFTIEQFVIEVATGDVYYISGTPINCKIRSTGEPGYIISNRSGTTLLLSQKEMESGDFVLKKDSQPIPY